MMEFGELFQAIKVPVTVVHVIGVVFGMGSALASDVLFSFYSKDKKLNNTEISTLSVLAAIVLYSLIIVALSGIALFLSDVDKYMQSAKFLAKISILVILLLNGYFLNKYVWPHLLKKNFFTREGGRGIRKLAFACGAISVISWLSICTLGVLNSLAMSYSHILYTYLGIILFGVTISLLVEKREFN